MTASPSNLAYKDCYDLMDLALESAVGIRVKVEDEGKAWYLRLRLHNARAIRRKENKEVYSEGDLMFGKSEYDALHVTIEHDEGEVWVQIKKYSLVGMEIEDLGETNAAE